MLLPYLVIKADQVTVLLSFLDEERNIRGECPKNKKIPPEMRARCEEVSEELKRLKRVPTSLVQ